MDHSRAPVLEALQAFRQRNDVVLAPPGHRQGRGADPRVLQVLGHGLFAADVLSMNGLDDRRQSQGVISEAQDLMADAVGAEQAFFATCGSSLSVKSAMLAAARPGEKLLVSRNAHKSVVAALVLGGIHPVWVHPHFDDDLNLAHPPEPSDVRKALEAHPDAKGTLLITPTDWGTCADIAGVAEVCHAAGVPLLVDEAWGAVYPFSDLLPTWGMSAGADLVVTSVHKMGVAVEQSSVFHLQGDLLAPDALKQREDLLATTSPSSLVYATLDGWRRQMVEHGADLLKQTVALADGVRDALARLEGIRVFGGDELLGEGKAFQVDPCKLVVDVRGLDLTGYQAAEWLRAACHLDVGSADVTKLEASFTVGDDEERALTLVRSLERLVRERDSLDARGHVDLPSGGGLELEQVMRPRDAFFADTEHVPIAEAVGRIAAEMASPYPPGVPAVVPGERITEAVADYLRSGVSAGMLVPDVADASLETLKVVRA